MKILRFRPEHLRELSLQSEQAAMRDIAERPEYGAALSLAGPAFSVEVQGRIVACIGVQEYGPHRAEAWALLTWDCGRYLRGITRAVRGWLEQSPYRRVETLVATDFAAGVRWATLLGFQREGPARRWMFPDGRSAYTYVRINDGHSAADNRSRACGAGRPAHRRLGRA